MSDTLQVPVLTDRSKQRSGKKMVMIESENDEDKAKEEEFNLSDFENEALHKGPIDIAELHEDSGKETKKNKAKPSSSQSSSQISGSDKLENSRTTKSI